MYMYAPYMYTCIYNTTDTVFHQSDAGRYKFFDACFCTVTIRGRLLFEGGACDFTHIQGWRLFFWKEINDGTSDTVTTVRHCQ